MEKFFLSDFSHPDTAARDGLIVADGRLQVEGSLVEERERSVVLVANHLSIRHSGGRDFSRRRNQAIGPQTTARTRLLQARSRCHMMKPAGEANAAAGWLAGWPAND